MLNNTGHLEIDNFEILFSYATIRTFPVIRNIFPASARRNTMFLVTYFLIINITTNCTLIFSVRHNNLICYRIVMPLFYTDLITLEYP